MLPIPFTKFGRILLISLLPILLSGCGTTLSPTKRKPLQIVPLKASLTPDPRAVVVRFENTLPGRPLVETVWDNVSGAFADAKESNQIGFSQDYSQLVPASFVGGVIGGAVVATRPEYTRIVIPFGRIFEGVLESGLRTAFPNVGVCADDACESEKLRLTPNTPVVRVKVVEFQVWEQPLNHLNMRAKVECTFPKRPNSNTPESLFTARREMTNRSMGSAMTTSSGFIREMNEFSNEFAAELSNEILPVIQTRTAN